MQKSLILNYVRGLSGVEYFEIMLNRITDFLQFSSLILEDKSIFLFCILIQVYETQEEYSMREQMYTVLGTAALSLIVMWRVWENLKERLLLGNLLLRLKVDGFAHL